MKPLLLPLLASLAASGCTPSDCESFGYDTTAQAIDAEAPAPAVTDLVVALVSSPQYPVAEIAGVRAVAGASGRVRIAGDLFTAEGAPAPRARLEVRGDTVFVSFVPETAVRAVCSPPVIPGETSLRVELPEGVTLRASVVVPSRPARAARRTRRAARA